MHLKPCKDLAYEKGDEIIEKEELQEQIKLFPVRKEVLDREWDAICEVRESLVKNKHGAVIGNMENCMNVLYRDPILQNAIRQNELTDRMVLMKELGWNKIGEELTDVDEYYLFWYFEKQYGISNEKKIREALHIIAAENSYHPVKLYLESLEWDGIPRIDNLLVKYLGADDTDYVREVMHLLMQAMIHRVYEPGAKYDIMVCLVGGQGAGKSTFFRFLAVQDEWFSDDIRRLDDEKVYQKLQSHWVMEMSEMLATVNAKSIEEIKSFLSRTSDNYRVPYQVHPKDKPRQCVFVGTTNNKQFLPFDRTGNRRFTPIETHAERVEKHILEDENESREYFRMAWAEAYSIYKNSDRHILKLSKKTEMLLTDLQEEFMPEDTLAGMILAWLEDCGEDYVCSIMIYKKVVDENGSSPPQWRISEINKIMNSFSDKWEKVSSHRFHEYGSQRGWKRIKSKEEDEFIPIPLQEEMPFK